MASTMGTPDRDPDIVFYHDDGKVEAIWYPRGSGYPDYTGRYDNNHVCAPSDFEYESTEYPFEV